LGETLISIVGKKVFGKLHSFSIDLFFLVLHLLFNLLRHLLVNHLCFTLVSNLHAVDALTVGEGIAVLIEDNEVLGLGRDAHNLLSSSCFINSVLSFLVDASDSFHLFLVSSGAGVALNRVYASVVTDLEVSRASVTVNREFGRVASIEELNLFSTAKSLNLICVVSTLFAPSKRVEEVVCHLTSVLSKLGVSLLELLDGKEEVVTMSASEAKGFFSVRNAQFATFTCGSHYFGTFPAEKNCISSLTGDTCQFDVICHLSRFKLLLEGGLIHGHKRVRLTECHLIVVDFHLLTWVFIGTIVCLKGPLHSFLTDDRVVMIILIREFLSFLALFHSK